jgi:hypothetical protein
LKKKSSNMKKIPTGRLFAVKEQDLVDKMFN